MQFSLILIFFVTCFGFQIEKKKSKNSDFFIQQNLRIWELKSD
jgi:hypothetical protein